MRKKKTIRRRTLKEKRKRRRIILTLVSFALVFGAGWGFARLSHSESLSVSDVKIEGNNLIPAEELIKIIKKETASAYLGIFSKNNIFLLPREKIEKEISSTFKTVEAAELSFDGVKTIKVSVQERSPHAVWCGSTSGAGSSGDCYYMDETGYIFNEAPNFSGNVYFKYSGAAETLTSESAKADAGAKAGAAAAGKKTADKVINNNPVGSQFLTKAEFMGLSDFVKNVDRLGMKSVALNIKSPNEAELSLATGGRIIFSRKIDYKQTIQNLDSVIAAEQTKSPGVFLKNLDYIDIRFSGKAFVKSKLNP